MSKTLIQRTTLSLAVLAFTTIAALAQQIGPGNFAPNPGQPTNPGGSSGGAGSSVVSVGGCTYDLGFMRRPSTDDIAAIRTASVVLSPVCEVDLIRRNDYGTLFQDGNVNGLRSHIGRNELLMAALRARDYDEEDVVALRFGANDSIILYVHQRDM